MRTIVALLLGCWSLVGCGLGEGIGSWRDATFGLVAEDEFSALERVLESAEGTPGNQSLLYVAMVEAEAEAQSASRAVANRESPEVLATALGEVIYAIRPDAAPDWGAKAAGLVPGWGGHGYGLIRAGEEMLEALEAAAGRSESAEAARAAAVCVDHTLELAGRTLSLAQSLLAGLPEDEEEALLPQLERLAGAQLKGLDANGDGEIAMDSEECALQQASEVLRPLGYDVEPST